MTGYAGEIDSGAVRRAAGRGVQARIVQYVNIYRERHVSTQAHAAAGLQPEELPWSPRVASFRRDVVER